MAQKLETRTLEIINFKGQMTPYLNGDVNSGLTNVIEVGGNDPFTQPGTLSWSEGSIQIDPTGSVITDLIMCGKGRTESGVSYVYAVGHTGRVYKIQVNDPTTYNPDYDNPVLLTTLSINTPTFKYGGFIDFFGSTQRIFIGHDKGVTRIEFDGSNETFVGDIGSWTQNVPRPLCQFLGKEYIGNGSNIAELDATATITSYAKLSPGFPTNTQVRDIDTSPDGNYLQSVVSELALEDITLSTPNTSIVSPSNSFIFKWNGTDIGYTSFITYPSTVLSASAMFGNYQYVFGYDALGGGVWNPVGKLLTSTPASAFGDSPNPNAVASMSNLVYWASTLPYEGNLQGIICIYGTISEHEIQGGYWCPFFQLATGTETDIVKMPCQIVASNFAQGASSNGYTDSIFGRPKMYFSTIETSTAPTKKYKFYKWAPITTKPDNALIGGLYQTQNQLLGKKCLIKEVRIYGEPWVTGASFTIDMIGSDANPIPNASMTYTEGVNITAGDDFAWYNPASAPTYTIGLRITNLSNINFVINKVEIDYIPGGK